MEIVKLNEIEYINFDDFFKKAPIYCKDSRNGRELIKNKKIKDFIYVRLKENKWIITDGKSYKYDKILFKKSFIDTIKEITEPIIIDNKYETVPDIIHLDNNEKFKDNEGNIIEIETLGERKVNNIYFKVKDVMIGFGMDNLITTIIDKNTTYNENIDYKYFYLKKEVNKQIKKKELYLTYRGLLRVLFVSRNGKTDKFIKWATETLFTGQLGEQEDKDNLASDLLGVNAKTIKDVFKTNSSKTPVVYLYLIGNANQLLKNNRSLIMQGAASNYNENDILCKYGCTDDLERRCSEHDKKYNKEFNTKIELLCFSIIESKYIFEAESNITQYFKSNLIEYKNSKELIVINKKDISQIKQHYKMIQNSYIGRYDEMNNKISLLEKEIIELNNKILLKDKDIEILIGKHNNELKDKDIKILEYKIKLLELNIK
jgi:hypothetical protein